MQVNIPYRDIISLQIEAHNINYRKTSNDKDTDIYVIGFNARGFIPLSTMVKKRLSTDEIKEEIISSLCASEQGRNFAEIAYISEHLALADCQNYSVELDSNAYLVYVKLSENTEIYGAIGKEFNLSQASMFFRSKRVTIDSSDKAAIDMLSTIEKNITSDKIAMHKSVSHVISKTQI